MSKIPIKSEAEIAKMRAACALTAHILDEVASMVRPGVSTEDINTFVHDLTVRLGAMPSPLHYKGYPKSVCTSVNDVVCHGIPDPYVILKAGDIINIDVTSCLDGYHGDSSRMYFVGGEKACSAQARDLVHVTEKALYLGIETVRPGGHVGDVGAAIQEFIRSTGKNYGIVRDYTGHGIGRQFHEPPQVLHIGKRGLGDELRPGMTFTVEPMINVGSYKTSLSKVDGWTVRTVDGSLSAQWEHTVLVTADGHEILTKSNRPNACEADK